MKIQVTEQMFLDSFRAIRPDTFSREGLRALFQYFEDLESDCGIEIELDVIAICCDFVEYDSLQAIAEDYRIEGYRIEGDEDAIREHLQDRTQVIEFGSGVIIQAY
jgi:hypothetical protein